MAVATLAIVVGCSAPAPKVEAPPTAPAPQGADPPAQPPEQLPVPTPEDRAAAARKRLEGLDLRSQSDLSAAIAAFTTAASLDPTNLNGLVLLGWTLHLDGQSDRAIATLQQALERDPDHIPALNALGIAYLVAGDLAAAVATHTRAVEGDPNNEIAFYNLSLAYERLQQFDRAIATAERAAQLEPTNPHPWVALSLAHWSDGNGEAAQQHYRQAIALDGRYGSSGYLDHLIQAGFAPEQVTRVRALSADLR